MTKQEARIIMLEDALRQAQDTVEFLHECLTHPTGGYSYKYPEHTLQYLEEWKKLALRVSDRLGKKCYHSMNKLDCECCQVNHTERLQFMQARRILDPNIDDKDKLGILAFEFRNKRDYFGLKDIEPIVKEYAEVVERLIKSGIWDACPPPEDQLSDTFMPKAFFEHFGVKNV